MSDVPTGEIRLLVYDNPASGRFGLRMVNHGPRLLTPAETHDVLTSALRLLDAATPDPPTTPPGRGEH